MTPRSRGLVGFDEAPCEALSATSPESRTVIARDVFAFMHSACIAHILHHGARCHVVNDRSAPTYTHTTDRAIDAPCRNRPPTQLGASSGGGNATSCTSLPPGTTSDRDRVYIRFYSLLFDRGYGYATRQPATRLRQTPRQTVRQKYLKRVRRRSVTRSAIMADAYAKAVQ